LADQPLIRYLAASNNRIFKDELKLALRNDQQWEVFTRPELVDRTREMLTHMVESIDAQKVRAVTAGTATPEWLGSVNSLRRHVRNRLDPLLPEVGASSASKETRAWKTFSALLVDALVRKDDLALDRLHAPYGGMTAREWLDARKAKAEVR
jgi:hypothetical protein